jgi:hypothetical protein
MPVKTKAEPESVRLANWRFEALVNLGLAPDQAISLMNIQDVVHAAHKLADQGCPAHLIVSLLEE